MTSHNLIAAVALALFVMAVPATAHVILDLSQAPADSYVRVAIRVSHGCAGAATTGLRVEVPAGLQSVKPAPKPGWTLTIVPGDPGAASAPSGAGGHEEGATKGGEVAWRGGPLPNNEFDEFLLMFHTPATPGETLWFPFVQECEGGAVTRWIEHPQAGQPAPSRPAWGLRLIQKP